MRTTRFMRGVFLAASVAVCADLALAGISNVVFEINASNGSGSGSYQATFGEGTWDPPTSTYSWALAAPIQIEDSGTSAVVATLQDASVRVLGGNMILLDFDIVSGTSLTTFDIKSPLVSFPTIPAELSEARASVSARADDLNNDGVELLGIGPAGTGSFMAEYNGFAPNGTVFSQLMWRIRAGAGGFGTGGQTDPGAGYLDIPGSVSDISSMMLFTLTAEDSAEGSTFFEIIPEPASGGLLLVLGAFALIRRR